jgi:acyl-coenzyme A thioesterase PaaI-like protein
MQKAWASLSPKPGGKALFSMLFGTLVPYSGSIKPEIVELRPGYAKMRMRDRKAVRNHLNSVHAIALMNLAEATSGLAMNFGLPENARAIVTKLEIEYLKKARGTLTSECSCGVQEVTEDREVQIVADISNEAGEVVARAIATWRVGPRPA